MTPPSRSTILVALTAAVLAGHAAAEPPRARVVLLVDQSVYPELRGGLETYAAHVLELHDVACVPLPDDYYHMRPSDVRAVLKREYEQPASAEHPRLAGAILVGPIPHALSGDAERWGITPPAPLFYEDFDAEWVDANDDGAFEQLKTDRLSNATEIWTAWWVPPAQEPAEQAQLLKAFLDKLDRYYRGELVGRDQMLWMAGNVLSVEMCEGWTVLLKDTMKPLGQHLHIWCRVGQDAGTFRPNKRQDEFSPTDLVAALTLRPWQHCHICSHGSPRGWHWNGSGVVAAPPADGQPEAALLLDLDRFAGHAGNIITTSGCSNGNFRGDYIRSAYERSLGNRLLFSTHTATIAFYGAASPQSTSGFAAYCTELIESLRPDGGSFLANGYFKMRNHDYSWGTQHYFFRGGDDKVLLGDPFARYRDSRPQPAVEAQVRKKIEAAGWTVVGPG